MAISEGGLGRVELNQLTIKQAQEGLKKKEFSSRELVEACLERIKKVDKKINAFITVCEEEAIKQAKRIDTKILRYKQVCFSQARNKDIKSLFKQCPLLGIPVAVKDNFCTRGIKTTAASKVLENYIPVYDATVIRKLKDAGAIILGKTNLDAFMHGSSTEASDFFTTYNPWNLSRLPGGSSGGSAASVIADETIFSIGTETAGSIRQPSAWCGIAGIKPTYGRVSRYGIIAMASSLDCPGPMTKSVLDAALILKILAGKDPLDATTSFKRVSDYTKDINLGIKGVRIGVPKEYFVPGIQRGVEKRIKEAIKVLGKLGAKIKNISLIDPKYAVAVYTIIQRSEVSSNLARYDGIRYGNPRDAFGEEARRRIMLGTYTLSAGYYEAFYLKAQKMRTKISQDFERVFKKVDLIVGPTSPSVALPVGASKDNPMFGELEDILVEPSTIAGLPGLNICCGFLNGLPVGIQIVGPQFSEELLFQVGYAYEQATEWHKRRPKL